MNSVSKRLSVSSKRQPPNSTITKEPVFMYICESKKQSQKKPRVEPKLICNLSVKEHEDCYNAFDLYERSILKTFLVAPVFGNIGCWKYQSNVQTRCIFHPPVPHTRIHHSTPPITALKQHNLRLL